MKTTAEQFQADIEELAHDLVRAYGLTFTATGQTADDKVLYRWMDYRLRHIATQPREVKKSSRFPVPNLPAEIKQALSEIEARFANGEDVNPYLSKTTIGNDISSSKSQRRTDGLWADWRIHHIHLTTAPVAPGQRFSARSDWLLFVMVYDDTVAFIDVRSHNESDLWTQDDLLKTFIDSWPEQAEPYRINGMRVVSGPKSSNDIKLLRNAGVTVPVEHKGEHYFGLGGGVTSAVTSTAVSMACIEVMRSSRHLALWLDAPDNPIRLDFNQLGVANPEFCLAVEPSSGLVIAERSKADRPWALREFDAQGRTTSFGTLQHRLLPAWAIPTLIAHLTPSP